MSQVLLLGAGLVAAPAIRYLAARGISTTIAANNPERARLLLGEAAGEVVTWSVEDHATLAKLLEGSQVVISLLPAPMHLGVAQACIDAGRSLVTASYATPEMQALGAVAQGHGVVLLNEMGLDPGIDHMSAMRLIDAARERGEKVTSFRSYCGGVPTLEANNNPWGYKFSWSPEGVLRATLSAMRYRSQGEVIDLPPEGLEEARHELKIEALPVFEAYPNRDSLGYESIYHIEGVKTLLRGTLRWPGWCAGVGVLRRLGLLTDEAPGVDTWPVLLCQRVGANEPLHGEALRAAVARYLQVEPTALPMDQLAFLGLFSPDQGFSDQTASVRGALAQVMDEKMSYGQGERDLIAMHHELITRRHDGVEAVYTSSLIVRGAVEETAMAKTVGIPAAIGAKMLLDGGTIKPGTRIPVAKEIYEPALRALEAEDIVFTERMETRPARRP
ncbi:MAG: saccharopine dehydrogenase NADP-binding domain-containing protein [Deltaproteobacteria bacterium]|nr:saccharopine dehydrogenase NADP-binding domain-containing protein [Deltaproteobacteria bacterium]